MYYTNVNRRIQLRLELLNFVKKQNCLGKKYLYYIATHRQLQIMFILEQREEIGRCSRIAKPTVS